MLAEAPGLTDPLASWRSSTAGKDIKRQQGGKHQRQASSQRSCILGLEMKPELVWEDWDLQREFTKTLVLKNIHNKLQKLLVRPPVSKFFTTLIPQTVIISPGTSLSVPVTFKPLQRHEYEDSIEFQGKDGSFQVCLRATIPCHVLEVPDSVQLPICAVQNPVYATFLLRNVSKLQTCFQWECTRPFKLCPEQGLLKPGQECDITVVFQPHEALLYQQQAYCRFGDEGDKAESCCTVLLQGLAKYPFLQFRNLSIDAKDPCDPVLRFGSVAVGHCLQKHFDIFNPSPVTASFSLSQLSSEVPLLESHFSCDVTRGKVAPGASLRVTATFMPAVVDTVSVEYLSLKCRGALKESQLKLMGNCIGPKVSLSSPVVDFGCVGEGGAVTQTVELVNSLSVEAIYQVDLDSSGHSVFSIQPSSGTLRPHSYITLKAVYRPTQPIAHHRRVACLILHRDPVFLDLIGTCHSELQKPAILKPEHLVLYKLRWYKEDPPNTLSAMTPNHHNTDEQGVLCPLEESHQRPDSAGVVSRTPMEEYFQSCFGYLDPLPSSSSLSSPHVSVVPADLLFNHKTSSSMSTSSTSSQFVSITNHTRGKLSLVWTAAAGSPFSVSPSSCDLAPLKSTSFRVTYNPKQLNTLHAAQLECYAYYKDNHHMKEPLLCPPWCVTVRVIGHSFQPGKEHFIPCCSLKPARVVFAAPSILSYRTVLLQNHGELPLTFCLDRSSNPALAESVSIVPTCGLIQPGTHQILTIRTCPSEDSPKQGFSLHLQLNATKPTKELTVIVAMEKPCISLEGDGNLYFHPTAVGSRTQRSHHIRNLSCLPLRFQWNIPEPDQKLISVEPDAGELHPNESSVQMWSFSPLAEETYRFKPTLTFWPIQTAGCNTSQRNLKVVGTGAEGFIEAEKTVLDIGEILVGGCRSIEIPLVNKSPCPVSFCLSVQQTLQDEDPMDDLEAVPALQLDYERGSIASHSTMLLRSTVRPQRRARYLWTISYQTLNASGLVSSPPQAVCEMRARGVFPTLKVIDLCGGGSVGRLRKMHLWKLFSLDSLNELLLSNPSPTELTHPAPTRHSLRSCTSIFTKAILDFNFSAAPLNSEPSTFVLMFHNPGSIPVDWAFLFPEDQQIELEYWAETGEFTSTELDQMKVQDNHLFGISPRSGTLLPGQQRAVHFTYRHDFAGMDRFPVVFKLSYGREILLNFQGVTVERNRSYLHFASKRHVFTSVAVGDRTPPKQVYELHNGGAVSVHYEVDLAALSQLQEDNFDHPVLCCLNPQGEILPGETAPLEWIFSPLEAKMYHMDVPIHVQDGDTTLLRFEGCGLNFHAPGSKIPFNSSDTKASEPCVQRLPFPGQVAFLSEDSISLGDISVNSQSSRIFFLTNVTHRDTVHFTWDKRNQQVVQIHPERGRLCPGESALCVLTFTSTEYPICYQLDVICQVIQEATMTRYHDALQRWEEEEQRQKDEFTITDKSLSDNQRVLTDKELVAAPVRKGPPLRKYKTLPPISSSGSCETVGTICTKLTRAERRALREKTKVWRRPEPPQPALLHLEVTAHSHGLHEYHTLFPDQFNKHYRCLGPVGSQDPGTTSSSTSLPAGLPSLTHEPRREIITHILTSLLWSILDDPNFTQSLIDLPSKPVTCTPPDTGPPHSSSEQREQHHTVDEAGTAGCSGDALRTQTPPHTEHEAADMCEDVLLNTIQNLMMEAFRGELDLTAHPRAVILPPASAGRASRTVVEEQERENMNNTKEPAAI